MRKLIVALVAAGMMLHLPMPAYAAKFEGINSTAGLGAFGKPVQLAAEPLATPEFAAEGYKVAFSFGDAKVFLLGVAAAAWVGAMSYCYSQSWCRG